MVRGIIRGREGKKEVERVRERKVGIMEDGRVREREGERDDERERGRTK